MDEIWGYPSGNLHMSATFEVRSLLTIIHGGGEPWNIWDIIKSSWAHGKPSWLMSMMRLNGSFTIKLINRIWWDLMGIQWHISPTSQYGKLYFPWYVMDHHNPCWESTDWALLTWDGDGWCAPPNCTWEMVYRLYHIIQYNGGLNPIPSAFSIRKRPNNGGGNHLLEGGKDMRNKGMKWGCQFWDNSIWTVENQNWLAKNQARERLFCEPADWVRKKPTQTEPTNQYPTCNWFSIYLVQVPPTVNSF